jgi:CBS domain-containing protein
MSADVILIPSAMSLHKAAQLLSRANVNGAPVVDGRGHCIGVVSARDFLHWAEQEQGEQPRHDEECMCSAWQLPENGGEQSGSVAEIMTRDPVLIAVGTPIGKISRMMLDAHLHRVVVVDAERRPIGVVSSTDILAAVYRATRSDT